MSTSKPAKKQAAAVVVPAKAPTKPAAKRAAPVAKKAAAKTAPAAARVEAKKPARRLRLVRDSFTMPESDIALIAKLKTVALGAQRAAKKSELLRAGLHALAALDAKALVAALDALEAVKTGRPKKG